MVDLTPIDDDMSNVVGQFQMELAVHKAAGNDLRAQWLAIETAASVARRAYFTNMSGDDAVSRAMFVVRRLGPTIIKYFGTGSVGVAITSAIANAEGTTGVIGALKSVLGLG